LPVRRRIRDDGNLNVAAVRNNLWVGGSDDAREPSGQVWTVRITRPTDPRSPWVIYSNDYPLVVLWRRAIRALRRDRRWFVEALAAPQTDWRRALVVAQVDSKDAAVERAIDVLNGITNGDSPIRSAQP
jgi:hypothetical protein